jgi:very-short-patch-repair endonuclease
MLLTKGELAFYDALANAIGDRSFAIMSKVRLMDLVYLPDGQLYRRTWVHRASQKHVDFVVCHRAGMRPFLIVELDDRSHMTPRAQRRDEFVDAVLQHSGWPIERVLAQSAYDVSELAERVRAHARADLATERTQNQ